MTQDDWVEADWQLDDDVAERVARDPDPPQRWVREKVKLTLSEMLLGAIGGVLRQVENVKLKRAPTYGSDNRDAWAAQVGGALGEMAFAKSRSAYWGGKGVFRGKDVDGMQVRATPYHNGHLLLHPEDSDDDWFWLVVGSMLDYEIAGCIKGSDGKLGERWGDPKRTGRPAFWVPQDALQEHP